MTWKSLVLPLIRTECCHLCGLKTYTNFTRSTAEEHTTPAYVSPTFVKHTRWMYSRNFHIYGVRRVLHQTSRFVRMFLIHAATLSENNRHSFDTFGSKCTSLEMLRRIHMPSNRSISLFGYPTASESGPCPWDSWNGITVTRFRDAVERERGRGARKFGRFHESQMRDEMTLNSRTFARTTSERAT